MSLKVTDLDECELAERLYVFDEEQDLFCFAPADYNSRRENEVPCRTCGSNDNVYIWVNLSIDYVTDIYQCGRCVLRCASDDEYQAPVSNPSWLVKAK